MRLEISCQDRVGIAQEVLGVFVERKIDLRGIELKKSGKIFLNIPDMDFSQLQDLMPKLRLIDGIDDVKTTDYMPIERIKYELSALIETIPEPLLSIDASGNIRIVNNAFMQLLNCERACLVNQPISDYVKGLSVVQWFADTLPAAQTRFVVIAGAEHVAEFTPLFTTDASGKQLVAGALLTFKSYQRLGQQLNAFNQVKREDFSLIQASSAIMKSVLNSAKRLAVSDSPLLIIGETGTGKELFAKACHYASERAHKKFMSLNCAALPDDVAESELFGIADNNAQADKKGLFELADGGTLFLDEVSAMSTTLQGKMLRVLQDGSFRKINSEREIVVNVRIISTTNQDLLAKVAAGEFREDLYYRLNVLMLSIPPLREREQDILPLAHQFILQAGQRIAKQGIKLSVQCRQVLKNYFWPGNVRQLENVITNAVAMLDGNVLEEKHLSLPSYSQSVGYIGKEFSGTLTQALKTFEAELLTQLYPEFPSSRLLAKKLGVSHTAIANKLRQYRINTSK